MPVESKKTPECLTFGDKDSGKVDYRQMCKYGKDCYQKNPMHHQKFRHEETAEEKAKEESKKRPLEDAATESPSPAKAAKLSETETEQGDKADGACLSKGSPGIPTPSDEKEPEVEEEEGDIIPPMDQWPKDPKESIEQKCLVKMPRDFFAFWKYCQMLNRENPREAFLEIAGIRLVGPFDFMPDSKEEFKSQKLNDYLCHWRYFYDPPEFQTVLASDKSKFHIGYFRDDPSDEKPAFVASSNGEDCKLVQIGDNLFGAVYNYLGTLVQKADPFKQASIQKMKQALHVHVSMKHQDDSFLLDARTQQMKMRDRVKVCSTFHGCGMVVPYNKATQVGYREIPETPANLKKMFAKVVETENAEEKDKNAAFDSIQELVTNVQFANDEGDPGMGLELGLNAFMYGGKSLHSTARHLLNVAYDLLDRKPFAKIVNAHLNRRKDVFKAE